MGLVFKWNDFWDYFRQLEPRLQEEMKPQLVEMIKNTPQGIRKEILENAPAELSGDLKATQMQADLAMILEKRSQMSPEQKKAEIKSILERPIVRKKLRNSRYTTMDTRWTIRRMAYYLARGLFSGRRATTRF